MTGPSLVPTATLPVTLLDARLADACRRGKHSDRDDRTDVTIAEAARVLAIGRTTLYELIADGALEVVRIGGSARVPLTALQTFVDQRRPGR